MNDYIAELMVGQVFCYNGGLFVICEFDWDTERYPNLCIASRNPDYGTGACYYFDDNTVAESTVSSAHLRSCFIPKGNYEDR